MVFVFARILSGECGRDGIHLRSRLIHGDAMFEARNDVESACSALLGERVVWFRCGCVFGKSGPKLHGWTFGRKVEITRGYPDDGESPAIDCSALTNNRRVAAKIALPQFMAEDSNMRSRCFLA